jgi:hypothetical protein
VKAAILTPRPEPSRALPIAAAATVLGLALPVFLVAGWRVTGWVLGAVLWAGGQAFALLLTRLRAGMGNLAAASVVAFGMMFRAIAVMVVVIAVAAADAGLGLAAGLLYALAYTLELAVSLVTFFGAEVHKA